MAIDKIADIAVLDDLAAGTLLLYQLTDDVIRVVMGMDLTPVEWSVEGGMALNFKTMAIMVPQPRCDYDGRCGIITSTEA